MDFVKNKPIFKQIAEMVCNKIIDGTYAELERIPSVRDLAVQLKVNPNTVFNSFTELADTGIIEMKRGIGFICATHCVDKARTYLEQVLIHDDLKVLFKKLHQLGYTEKEIIKIFN